MCSVSMVTGRKLVRAVPDERVVFKYFPFKEVLVFVCDKGLSRHLTYYTTTLDRAILGLFQTTLVHTPQERKH